MRAARRDADGFRLRGALAGLPSLRRRLQFHLSHGHDDEFPVPGQAPCECRFSLLGESCWRDLVASDAEGTVQDVNDDQHRDFPLFDFEKKIGGQNDV